MFVNPAMSVLTSKVMVMVSPLPYTESAFVGSSATSRMISGGFTIVGTCCERDRGCEIHSESSSEGMGHRTAACSSHRNVDISCIEKKNASGGAHTTL